MGGNQQKVVFKLKVPKKKKLQTTSEAMLMTDGENWLGREKRKRESTRFLLHSKRHSYIYLTFM